MRAILLAVVVFCAAPEDLPWQDLAFSIEQDFSVSSDTVTLCRVRVVNRGNRSWPGSRIFFEALALDGGVVMARQKGRFGLSLAPRDSLETVVAFEGRYRRFEVRSLSKGTVGSRGRRGAGAKPSGPKRRKHS